MFAQRKMVLKKKKSPPKTVPPKTLGVKKNIKRPRYITKRRTILNANRQRKVYVSVRKGLNIAPFVKKYMKTLTPYEQAKKNRGNIEVSSQFNVLFDKNTLKIIDMQRANVGTRFGTAKSVIEYAVRKNLNTLSAENRAYILNHWNGYIYINIKKEVSGSYMIPWHRDALSMEILGKKTKSFAVGALYVSIPKYIVGGNIQFRRNNKVASLRPSSGTSVLFIDDELFHRVTDIEPPRGVQFLPRSAMFILYGTDTQTFKRGIAEYRITGNRNYKAAYERLSQNLRNNLNRVINDPSLLSKSNNNMNMNNRNANIVKRLNQQAKNVFNSNNANHKNLIALYTNMKKAFNKPGKLNSSFVLTGTNKRILKLRRRR